MSSGVRGLGVRGEDLVLFSEDTSYSYVEGAGQWSEIGGIASVKQSDRSLVKTNSAQTIGDYAALNGIGIVAWLDSRNGIYLAIVEDDEGRVTMPPRLVSVPGYRPLCVRCGDKLALLWLELGQIKLIMVDPAQPHTFDESQYPRVIVDDLALSAPVFDAVYLGVENELSRDAAAICWNAVEGIRVGVLDPSGVIGSPVTGWVSPSTLEPDATVTAGPTLVAAPWRHDKIAVAWATATESYVAYVAELAIDTLLSTPVGLGTEAGVDALTLAWRFQQGEWDGDVIEVWAEHREDPARLSKVTRKRVDTGANVVIEDPDPNVIRGSCLASKAWTDAAELDATDGVHTAERDRAYVVLQHDVPLFGVYLTVRDDGLVVARTLPSSTSAASDPGVVASVISDGGRTYRWVAGYKSRLNSVNKDVFTEDGLRLVEFDFGASDSHQTAYLGRTLYVGGGCLYAYDGVGWVEASPHYAPDWEDDEVLHVNAETGGGGLG